MEKMIKQVISFCMTLILIQHTDNVFALDCVSGTEPVLKIEYQAEDHSACLDPALVGKSRGATRGISKKVLYQTKQQRLTVATGKCVAPAGLKNKRTIYKNLDLHMVRIANKNKRYFINMTEMHGSVRYGNQNDVFEVKSKAYTNKEFSKFKKKEILPGYICGVVPPLLNDPANTVICSADIDGLRVILYKEYKSFVSDHINTYKATSIEKVCEDPAIFEPPEGVTLVKDY